tara:strand:- start:1912 stop:2919 length:1008 start_codon:yes stop_codon:yes gene_type:complete
MKILVTGCAGFIGYHVTKRLLSDNHNVIGIDNINNYYNVKLKKDRIGNLEWMDNWKFEFKHMDVVGMEKEDLTFRGIDVIIHLAAQAGVRHSIDHPEEYLPNITGFQSVLETARNMNPTPHLVYASSGSVYGVSTSTGYKETDNTDHPYSLYAATKKSNEVTAEAYSRMYGIPCTGLRLFSVYGPWGRPDMALWKFTKAILEDEEVELYGSGSQARDFTYVDDAVEGLVLAMERGLSGIENPRPFYHHIFNVGSNNPVPLYSEDWQGKYHFVKAIEDATGKKLKIKLTDYQLGDISFTNADISKLQEVTTYRPRTFIKVGVQNFVDWYKDYHDWC